MIAYRLLIVQFVILYASAMSSCPKNLPDFSDTFVSSPYDVSIALPSRNMKKSQIDSPEENTLSPEIYECSMNLGSMCSSISDFESEGSVMLTQLIMNCLRDRSGA